MADETRDVLVRIQGDTSGADEAMRKVNDQLDKTGKTATTTTKSMTGLTAAEKAYAAKVVATNNALKSKAKALGISVGEMKKMQKSLVGASTAQEGLEAATRSATKEWSAYSQVNKNLAFQIADVFQSVQAGQAPMRALSMQASDVGFQYISAATAMGDWKKIAAAAGKAGPIAAVGIAAVGTAVAVVANATQESRMRMAEYEEAIDDADAASRRLIQSQNALGAATNSVADFVGGLKIQAALLNGEISDADVKAGDLGGELASKLRPRLLEAGKAYAENEARIQKLKAAMGELRAGSEEFRDANKQLTKALGARDGLSDNLDQIKALADEGREAINEFTVALESDEKATNRSKDAKKGEASARREALKAAREEAAEVERLLAMEQAREEASQELLAIAGQAAKTQLTEEEKLTAELREQLVVIAALEAASGDGAAADRARAEVTAEFSRNRQQLLEDDVAAVEKTGDAIIADLDRQIAAAEAAEQKKLDFQLGMAQAGADALADITDGLAERGVISARTAAAVAKSAALFEVGVNTAAAITRGMAIFGPPPSPPGVAAVAAATAIGGLQAGAILAQPVPTFHTGGVVRADLLTGESVLNRDATARMGADGVDRLNRGGGLGERVTIVNQHKHRIFDRQTKDSLQLRNSALSKQFRDLRRELSTTSFGHA